MTDIYNNTKANSRTKTKKTKKSVTYKKEIKNMPTIAAESPERHRLAGHSHNPMSAFSYFPDKVKFVTEDPEEEIVLLLRHHPITNIKWSLFAFLMIIAPSFANVVPMWDSFPWEFQLISIIIWYLITTAFIFEEFLSWFFHVNIITDERILEVDFINLIYREMTEANISNIEDVTVEMGGTLRTFFNFGNIIIQTASEVPRIVFEDVPNPDKVAKILRELRIQEEVEELEGRVR